jgi:hypothetical protein
MFIRLPQNNKNLIWEVKIYMIKKTDGLVKSPNIVIPAGLCPFGVYPERIEMTGFPRIGYGAGLVKSGMTKQGFPDFLRFH